MTWRRISDLHIDSAETRLATTCTERDDGMLVVQPMFVSDVRASVRLTPDVTDISMTVELPQADSKETT